VLFTSTDILEVKDKENNDKINIDYLEIIDCNIENIDEFLPVAKTEPFKPLFSQWMAKKEDIEVCRNTYKYKNKEIEFIYIKENKSINNTMYNYFTVLLKPENLYEDKYISEVFSILKLIVTKNIDKNISSVIAIPRHLNKNSFMYNENDILDSLNWLRKNNS